MKRLIFSSFLIISCFTALLFAKASTYPSKREPLEILLQFSFDPDERDPFYPYKTEEKFSDWRGVLDLYPYNLIANVEISIVELTVTDCNLTLIVWYLYYGRGQGFPIFSSEIKKSILVLLFIFFSSSF